MTSSPMRAAPSPASGPLGAVDAPRALRPIVVLLMINLALSIALTIATSLALVPIALIVLAIGGGTAVPRDPAAMTVPVYLGAVTMALAYVLLHAGLRTTSGSAAVVATLLTTLKGDDK